LAYCRLGKRRDDWQRRQEVLAEHAVLARRQFLPVGPNTQTPHLSAADISNLAGGIVLVGR